MPEKAKAVGVNISMPVDMAHEIDQEAKESGLDFSDLVVQYIAKGRRAK